MSNIILIGFMGCGKSSIGRFMARNGYRLVDTDSVIEKDAGRTIKEIFADEGEEYFRRKETDILMELIQREDDNLVVAVGGGLPMHARNRALIHKLGVVVYLRAKVDTLAWRLRNDTVRPLLQTGNPRQKIAELMEKRSSTYEGTADVIIDTDGCSYEKVYSMIKEKIN